MDAVAAAAGVGKGTIFRRFGDRAGLTRALLDDYMRRLQDGFLSGPPPLGPGAPAGERLEAFVLELVRAQEENLELALAAEAAPGGEAANVYGVLALHIRLLLAELNPPPSADVETLAALILGAISPPVLHALRRNGADIGTLSQAALALLRGVTPPAPPTAIPGEGLEPSRGNGF